MKQVIKAALKLLNEGHYFGVYLSHIVFSPIVKKDTRCQKDSLMEQDTQAHIGEAIA